MIKAVFFDIDNTLLSHTLGKVPDSSRLALEALRARGIKLFTATGRHPIELQDLPLGGLSFDAQVLVNGSLVLDSQGRIIHSKALPPEAMTILAEDFAAKELSLMFVEKERMYINKRSPELIEAQAAISTPVPPAEDYRGAPVYQAVIYGSRAIGELYRQKLPTCSLTCWHTGAFDISSSARVKTEGILALLEHEALSPDEVMAFGDGENDSDMLAAVGLGVAMGNAHESCKKNADYVTAPIDEDGLALALQHFGLIGRI